MNDDIEVVDVGHSLPNAEEVKAAASSMGVSERRRNRFLIGGIGCLAVTAIILGLAIGFGAKSGSAPAAPINSGNQGNNAGNQGSGNQEPGSPGGGNQEPGDQGGNQGTGSDQDASGGQTGGGTGGATDPETVATRFQVVTDFLSLVSDYDALTTEGQSQNTVATWMSEVDAQALAVPTNLEDTGASKFIQRFVLALLYESMNGTAWTYNLGFMTSEDECSWTLGFGVGVDSYAMGATCNDDGEVSRLFLRKLKDQQLYHLYEKTLTFRQPVINWLALFRTKSVGSRL